MRPTPDHDKQLQRVKYLRETFDKFRTITGAADLLGDAIRPHLDAAAQMRHAGQVGVDQAAARARRLPEQVAAGELTLDQAAELNNTITAWTTPDASGKPAVTTLAEQAARCHEAAAIDAARATAPQLYELLVPFAHSAVAGADKAGRQIIDVPTVAQYVRQLKETPGCFSPKRNTHQAQRDALNHFELFKLVHRTAAQLNVLQARHTDDVAATFGRPPNGAQFHFFERNLDMPIKLAVAVELGWEPGYYPPADALPTPERKTSRMAATAGSLMRAIAGAR